MTTPVILQWLRQVCTLRSHSAIMSSARAALIDETTFVQMLRFECRRIARSGKRLILVLINSEDLRHDRFARTVATALSACTRETDVLGWYQRSACLGVLMTETSDTDAATIQTVMCKIMTMLSGSLAVKEFERVTFNYRLFPHDECIDSSTGSQRRPYPEFSSRFTSVPFSAMKRTMDVVGSLLALISFLPGFILIALIVKSTSEGPVLFRQKRIGQHGRLFTFLKFRTMYSNNDPTIHREFTAKLIAGKIGLAEDGGLYKLARDPRITPIGRLLRRSSLDELPQFLNVFAGQMSLVGPRPPLPYEYERYQVWHKRRVLEVKPGLTGPWQVGGRSTTTFDEMVRLDLRYANSKSLWTDCRILLRTPAAVFSGRGAC